MSRAGREWSAVCGWFSAQIQEDSTKAIHRNVLQSILFQGTKKKDKLKLSEKKRGQREKGKEIWLKEADICPAVIVPKMWKNKFLECCLFNSVKSFL